MEKRNDEPYWHDGAYYLGYVGHDGAWYVVYYYHGMATVGGATCSVRRFSELQPEGE
jgi:hypothetical protein